MERGRVSFVWFFCGFFVWAFEGLSVLVLGLWVLVGLEAGSLGGFPAGVGRFVKVVFGGGLLVVEGIPVVCSLEQAYPQGTFLQVPSFLCCFFFCIQSEWQTKRVPKIPLWLQKGLLAHGT